VENDTVHLEKKKTFESIDFMEMFFVGIKTLLIASNASRFPGLKAESKELDPWIQLLLKQGM